jgi:hypothetical protein
VLLGRYWTSEHCFRHGLRSSEECVLYAQSPEHLDHLLLQCPYSCEVWFKSLRRCGWQHLAPSTLDTFSSWWLRSRKRVNKPRHQAFDLLMLCSIWNIWLQRNDIVFHHRSSSPVALVGKVWEGMPLWCRVGLVVEPMLLGV